MNDELQIDAVNALIENYTQTWEYQGVTVVMEQPPRMNFVNTTLILEANPMFYVGDSQIVLGEHVYPFQWTKPSRYMTPTPQEGFMRMINQIIDNEGIWLR